MKVIIKDIPAKGLELFESIAAESIGLLPEDFQCLSPLTIKAKFTRVENTVLVNTKIKGHYSFLCARCLETIEDDFEQEFNFDYTIEKGLEFIDLVRLQLSKVESVAGDTSVSFTKEKLVAGALGEDIRQEIILSSSAKTLCKDDCKGICPGCGVNLNKETCQCKNRVPTFT